MAGWVLAALLAQVVFAAAAAAAPKLELGGYMDDEGAISVLHGGDSADPYFAMQALLLAHENGMNISAAAEKFVNWLVPRQKPEGTVDRFCRGNDKKWNMQFVAVTYGRAKQDLVTARYGWGSEGYLAIAANTQLVNFRSRESSLAWRHWLNPRTGLLVSANGYTKPSYKRTGVNVGILHDF